VVGPEVVFCASQLFRPLLVVGPKIMLAGVVFPGRGEGGTIVNPVILLRTVISRRGGVVAGPVISASVIRVVVGVAVAIGVIGSQPQEWPEREDQAQSEMKPGISIVTMTAAKMAMMPAVTLPGIPMAGMSSVTVAGMFSAGMSPITMSRMTVAGMASAYKLKATAKIIIKSAILV